VTVSGVGTVVLNASQAATANYSTATAQTSFTVVRESTTDVASSNAATINPNQSVTLTATVHPVTTGTPTGKVTFYDNGAQLGAALTLAGGSANLVTTLAAGQQHIITFSYSGDPDFLTSAASASTPVTVTVGPLDFTFTNIGVQSQTVVPSSGVAYTFSLTPTFGTYPGTVTFTATPAIPNATYTFSPATVAATGGTQTITFIVQTQSLAALQKPSRTPYIPIAFGLLLLPLAGMRRARFKLGRMLSLALLLVGSIAAVAGLAGCGSGNGYFGQPIQGYAITVTASSGTVLHSNTVNLQVQ